MLKITATNYDELVARADRPVLLDFWAELALAFRVQSIPMLVLLRDNAVVAAAVGAQSKEQLEQKLGL